MPTLAVTSFLGEMPRMEPRMLESGYAVADVNCCLDRGSLRPLRGAAFMEPLDAPAVAIFKHDIDGWFAWEGEVSAVKSAVADVDGEKPLGHVLVTGERGYPTQRLSGGEIHRLGIPRPSVAPVANVAKEAALATSVFGFCARTHAELPLRYGSEGALVEERNVEVTPYATLEEILTPEKESSIVRSSAYCYTFVQSLAGGLIQQESAPSPPSEVVDVPNGAGVTLSGFAVPALEGLTVSHIRIYRTVSGTTASDFHFLAELPAEVTSYTDTILDKDVSTEILRTSTWDPIPDDARGLIKTDNGIYAAFRGNELLVSEPFYPYAFPSIYRLTVEDTIIALGHVDATIVILTTGRPYLAQGGVPESLQLVHLPIEQACMSARSVASLPGGVIYASPDGLMMFTSNEQSLVSGQTFTREQWQELHPETLMGTVHDGRYVAFFSGTNEGFLFNLGRTDVVRVRFPEDWKVHALYHHSEDDCVYLSIETKNGYGVYRFEAGESLEYTWRSKVFFTSALTGMSCARVEGEQGTTAPAVLKVFGPDAERPRAHMAFRDSRTRRIPPTRSERLWSFEISGRSPVYEVRLGSSVEDLEYGR